MTKAQHIRYPNVFGSVSGTTRTRKTLTTSFVADTNNVIATKYMDHCKLVVDFLAGATNGFAEILVETSDDGTNWERLNTNATYGGTEVDVLNNPFVVPGDKTSGTGAAEAAGIEFSFTAEFIRVKAREASAVAVGSVYIEAIISKS